MVPDRDFYPWLRAQLQSESPTRFDGSSPDDARAEHADHRRLGGTHCRGSVRLMPAVGLSLARTILLGHSVGCQALLRYLAGFRTTYTSLACCASLAGSQWIVPGRASCPGKRRRSKASALFSACRRGSFCSRTTIHLPPTTQRRQRPSDSGLMPAWSMPRSTALQCQRGAGRCRPCTTTSPARLRRLAERVGTTPSLDGRSR